MNKSILHSAITAAMVISITACSSGGSDVAGIGGSGITSSGTITGFGSIFVNGVEFETNSSTFSVDDNPGTESDLATGMRVTVKGSVNSDGVTGTATSVTFDDQVQGPVVSVGTIDLDGTGRQISVLGTIVALDSTTTIFDISGTGGGAFDFDTIAVNNNVEVSGFADSAGVLRATRVELKEQTFTVDSSIVELKGTITGLVGTDFSLQGIAGVSIDASTATIDDLPGGLAEGASVEVKGTCPDPVCATVEATRVEGQSPDFGDNDDVEIEGFITRYVSDSDFDVDGFPVDASGSGVERIPSTLTLAIDKEVEVEGTVVGGKLVANKVKAEGGEIKIAATVDTVNAGGSSFDLEPVPGQTITVKIDTSTQIEDEIGGFNSAALLDNLNNGDYVVVEGYDDGTSTNTIIASEVKREPADDVILQGVATICSGTVPSGTISVLGVAFPYEGSTDFEDINDNPNTYANATDFCGDVTAGQSIVKIKDKESGGNAIGVADEIDLEQL